MVLPEVWTQGYNNAVGSVAVNGEGGGQVAELIAAWRSLGENPLLMLWRNPRAKPAVPRKRIALFIGLGLIAAFVLLTQLSIIAAIWLMVVWFQAVTGTMSTLSSVTRILKPGQVDELVGLTGITPVEVVAAVLWHNLRRLIWPVSAFLAAGDCGWIAAVFERAQTNVLLGQSNSGVAAVDCAAAVITFLPALAAQIVCSLLAVSGMLMLLLALGRGLSQLQVTAAAVMQVISAAVWLLAFSCFLISLSSGTWGMVFWRSCGAGFTCRNTC